MKLTNRLTNIVAVVLLVFCFLLAFLSIRNMSLTMDEKAHIPSGYSYLAFQDYRLNPEHPPLAKDLAAIPLLFLNLNFPTEHSCWSEDVNGQWECGYRFIFNSQNNPDQIIFWSRLPMILLLVLTGWFIFFWIKRLAGNKPALLALTLFSFSPTLLAHGRLVTTDVAAAFGFLLAIFFWIKFLKKPNLKNVFIAGLILGMALCLKFSLTLLVPILGFSTLVYAWLNSKSRLKNTLKYLGLTILAGIVALVIVIWPIYQLHIINYPIERQIRDTEHILASNDSILKPLCLWMTKTPVFRAPAYYLFGFLMARQRVAGGNTVYFNGEVSGMAWKEYFPIIYLLKIPLAFHLLTLLALILWLFHLVKTKSFKIFNWLKENITEFTFLILLLVYWPTSILGNLNIGVRHVIPTIPAMYILVSIGLFKMIKRLRVKPIKIGLFALTTLLVLYYISASLLAFPLYISYYNELASGSKNGYKYAVDSNYDWGQDLKRLADFVEKNNIEKIKLYYFGGDAPDYRLGEKREWLDPQAGPQKGWLAVSATLLQEGRAKPAPGYDRNTTFFNWLNNYQPVSRAGNSIFIYYID